MPIARATRAQELAPGALHAPERRPEDEDMIRTISRFLPLIAILLAAGQLPAQQDDESFGTPKSTTIRDLEAKPQAYKNVWITFRGTFSGIGELHNPFFTRFTRANHVNFTMWGEQSRLWVKEEFDQPCPTLFVSKLKDETTTVLYSLQRYQQIQVVGVVRNSFKGKPWIEITSIQPIGARHTTASLGHLHKAHQYIAKHEWKKAGIELGLANHDQLPQRTRAWINYYQGTCLMKVGQPKKALQALTAAKVVLGAKPELESKLALLQTDPKEAIDKTIRKKQVAKSERPFWETVKEEKLPQKPATPATPTPAK
jgi:hypothetical protein